MKKILPTLTILILTIILTQSALAIDPVIIRKATHGPPPPDKPFDQTDDYFSNSDDPDYKCGGIYKISESFEPKESETQVTDPATGEVRTETFYEPYDVNVIKGLFAPVKNNYTNKAIDFLRAQIASKPKASGDKKLTQKAFTSYDTSKPNGASNSIRRGTSGIISECLRGQRLVKATQCALDYGKVDYQVCHSGFQDEAIACEIGGVYRGLGEMEIGCAKNENEIRLSDIAIALSQDGYMDPAGDMTSPTYYTDECTTSEVEKLLFYAPDANCYINRYDERNIQAKLIPSPAHLSAFIKSDIPKKIPHPISPPNACKLFKQIVEATGTGSNGRKIHTCSLEDGKEVDCQKEYTSIPWGDTMTNTYMDNLVKPAKQEVKRHSLCAKTLNENESRNEPNPVSFSVFAKEFFGRIENVAQTFSKGMYYSFKMDTNLAKGYNSDINAIKNLLPKKVNDERLNDSILTTHSTTDAYGKTFDPGNILPRTELYKNLTPKNWQ